MSNLTKQQIDRINLMGFSGFSLAKIFAIYSHWSKEDYDLIKSITNNDFDFMREATE